MAEPYARKVTTMLVGQLAEVAGFDVAHGNAIDAVADVMIRFVQEVGMYSKEYAELQGRTDVNVLDVVESLQDFNMNCDELVQFAKEEPNDPFIQTIAQFPVYRTALQPPSFLSAGVDPPPHIPAHLPAFPAAHTIQFTDMKPREPDDSATEAAAPGPAPAVQSQEALIRLRQKMQVASAASRPNPFLALRRKQALDDTDTKGTAEGGGGLDVTDAFAPVLEQAREHHKRRRASTGDEPSDGDAKPSGREDHEGRGDKDSLMEDADEETVAAGRSGSGRQSQWEAVAVDSAAIRVSDEVLFRDGRVALSLDPTGAYERQALRERYTLSVRDAFLSAADTAAAATGAGRRRLSLHDPDYAKRLRAQEILSRGPDAILMEYPEGHVPRQGT